MIPQVLVDLAKPVAVCVLSGVLASLYSYQSTGKWQSALLAGGVASASVALSQLGVNGAVGGLQRSAAKTTLGNPTLPNG